MCPSDNRYLSFSLRVAKESAELAGVQGVCDKHQQVIRVLEAIRELEQKLTDNV